MFSVDDMRAKIAKGYEINKSEAMQLAKEKNVVLSNMAADIQKQYGQLRFEFCSIINAKSGACSEDCKFCAQSAVYNTGSPVYGFVERDIIIDKARICAEKGISRFSIVTSGKSLNDDDVSTLCEVVEYLKENVNIGICASVGLLSDKHYEIMRKSGVTRIHNNLETSKRYFSSICTTHLHEDKVRAIEKAKKHGFDICSGGIIGMGETIEDRIDLAFEAKELGVVSIPINIHYPIKGTPFGNLPVLEKDEIEKAVSLIKIINPKIPVRMAGGRKQLLDSGKGCFIAGSNAAITGDMLTTTGISIDEDISMVKRLGYIV